MFAALDISTSGLVAQRIRLAAIANNIANVSTTHNEAGEPAPYQPKFVVFQTDDAVRGPAGAAGVKVAAVESENVEPLWKYEPHNPLAIQQGERQGYVAYPNIDMTTQFVDALEASRAYEANIGVMEITKDINQQTLRLLA
jgi:flagellar basal-body rod protein FlgC